MLEYQKNTNDNLNQKFNFPIEKKIACKIKAWTELFSPGAADVRLQEAEAVAKFSNLFELLSSVTSAGLSIDDIFLPKNKEEEMFIEWFKSFIQKNDKSFFDKYL